MSDPAPLGLHAFEFLANDVRRLGDVGTLSAAQRRWRMLTPEARLAFLEAFRCCRGCGSLDERCHCENDA